MAFDELRSYYEAEAALESRRPLQGRRVEIRDRFIDVMHSEQRRSVVDFGAGPGRDIEAFASKGFDAVGLDLAIGNAQLAHRRGLTVVAGSITAAPLKAASFDAGWSMSTFMHLDDETASAAFVELASSLVSGAPIWVGVWGTGNDDGHRVRWDETIEGERRPFYRRTVARNREVFSAADLEHVEEYELGTSGYQLFQMRAR